MQSRQFAILQKGKIAALVSGHELTKMKKNMLPLTWEEYLFLYKNSVMDGQGIDVVRLAKVLRNILKKIKEKENVTISKGKRSQDKEV